MRLLLAIFLSLGANAGAIVWHGDRDSAPQDQPQGAMRNVARLHYTGARFFGGCDVQLDERWVLTSKHGVKLWAPAMLQVRIGDQKRAVKRIVLHPSDKIDLALIELREPVKPAEKIGLHTGKQTRGAKLWLGGYGKSGPVGKVRRGGKFAAGFNRLAKVENGRGKVVLDKARRDDVLPARMDSGSPVFFQLGKRWLLNGLTVTASNSKNPGYGDRSHHQLLAPSRKWLDGLVPGLVWRK